MGDAAMTKKKVLAMLGTYGRAFLACVVTTIVAMDVPVVDYTKADVVKLANAVWASFLPVLIRALNPNDTAYGVTVE